MISLLCSDVMHWPHFQIIHCVTTHKKYHQKKKKKKNQITPAKHTIKSYCVTNRLCFKSHVPHNTSMSHNRVTTVSAYHTVTSHRVTKCMSLSQTNNTLHTVTNHKCTTTPHHASHKPHYQSCAVLPNTSISH